MHMDDLELYDLFALLHIERREELGLSLKEAAKRTSVSPSWLRLMEQMERPATGRYILRAGAEFGIDLGRLLSRKPR